MENSEKRKIIDNYIRYYNNFDVNNMVSYLHEDVEFQNISQGHVTLRLNGKKSFTNQAREAVKLFEEREIVITDVTYEDEEMIVNIDYNGILAVDVPEGPSKGDKVELKGKSIFQFKDGKISSIKDVS